MTDEELFAFLSKAEEMNFQNWKTYRVLYDEKLRKLYARNNRLRAALREIADIDYRGNAHPSASIARAALGETDHE